MQWSWIATDCGACRLGGLSQQHLLQSPQGPAPVSGLKDQPFSFDSQPSSKVQQAQQNLVGPLQTPSRLLQQPASSAGNSARQTSATSSGPGSNAFSFGSDSTPKQHNAAAKSWTPMKAPNDLPHQALLNKMMKGKELPSNSLIAAGLDPTKPASTPRTSTIKTPSSEAQQLLPYLSCLC